MSESTSALITRLRALDIDQAVAAASLVELRSLLLELHRISFTVLDEPPPELVQAFAIYLLADA